MMMMNQDQFYGYEYSDEATAITNVATPSTGTSTPTSQQSSSPSNASATSEGTSTDTCTSSSSSTNNIHTIALFGGTGKVGKEFLHLALDAGYRVRMLKTNDNNSNNNNNNNHVNNEAAVSSSSPEMTTQTSSSSSSSAQLHEVIGSLNDPQSIRSVIHHADFVVCLLNDTLPSSSKNYPQNFLLSFVKLLYPLMREQPSIQLFLFQSMSLATDMNGKTPILSRLVKTVAQSAGGRSLQLQDHDAAIQTIAQQHQQRMDKENHHQEVETAAAGSGSASLVTPPHFSYLVTRPTVLIKDGPATKRLCASKSQPGPFPITCADLAEFTLNALLNTKLYNSCPYVVADSGL